MKKRYPSKHYRYVVPVVTLGPEAPLPEKRPEVVAKILTRLDSTGPFRQNYSNGEFITSSLAVARSFRECKEVKVLDTSSYTVHYDPALNVFWRHAGFFD